MQWQWLVGRHMGRAHRGGAASAVVASPPQDVDLGPIVSADGRVLVWERPAWESNGNQTPITASKKRPPDATLGCSSGPTSGPDGEPARPTGFRSTLQTGRGRRTDD